MQTALIWSKWNEKWCGDDVQTALEVKRVSDRVMSMETETGRVMKVV